MNGIKNMSIMNSAFENDIKTSFVNAGASSDLDNVLNLTIFYQHIINTRAF